MVTAQRRARADAAVGAVQALAASPLPSPLSTPPLSHTSDPGSPAARDPPAAAGEPPAWFVLWDLEHVAASSFKRVRADLARRGVATMVSLPALAQPAALQALGVPAGSRVAARAPRHGGHRFLVASHEGPLELGALLDGCRPVRYPRAGDVAHGDIVVEEGATGLDPSRTDGFAANNVPTKISQGQITVLHRKVLVAKGDRVEPILALFVRKLGLAPRPPLRFAGAWHRPTRTWCPGEDCCDVQPLDAHPACFEALRNIAFAAAAIGACPEYSGRFPPPPVTVAARPMREPDKGSSDDDMHFLFS